jgi:hypothetical protein
MAREQAIYCFISDDSGKFYRAVQQSNGSYAITSNNSPYPIRYNPTNLLQSKIEFGTNMKYFSMVRSIGFPLEFVKDGAAIIRQFYFLGKGSEQNLYLTIIEWNGITDRFELSYKGKFDFLQKKEDPKSGAFSIPTVDDSAWGVLSQNDDVEYSVDCSRTNPDAVKVLVDGITLQNRYTFQTVQAPIVQNTGDPGFTIPFVLVNEDGDSSGILTRSQTLENTANYSIYVQTSKNFFFTTFYQLNGVNISGSFTFAWSTNTLPSGAVFILFRSSFGQNQFIFSAPTGNLIPGKIYTVEFDFTWNLQPGENLFFIAQLQDSAARELTITPIVTNIYVKTETTAEPVIVYGLRSLDLLKAIVFQATRGRYTIDSEFFTTNKYDVCTSGDAIRGIENARIYTSFADWFKTFDSIYFLAIRSANGELFVEQADEVYNDDNEIIDLGDAIDVQLIPAKEFSINEIIVGSPKQDYRHPSGRLEFNSTNGFSLPVFNSKKKMDIVSKYRLGCYDIQFMILDYRGLSTQDNTGDKSVYVMRITDQIGTAVEDVQTFENINVNNAPLAPYIKHPLSGDVINNDKPFLKGVCPPGLTVNIYVDGVLDGSTVSDVNGDWTYQIIASLSSYDPGVFDGQHDITATYTTMAGALDTISVIIDTTVAAETIITYPQQGDSLYNNKPLIKGVAAPGTLVQIRLDGVLINTAVTDNSCRWSYKVVTPFTNGSHTLSVNAGADTATFTVDSSVAFPLITYIGSELDGFILVDNLPLIEGVAIPGTVVTVWLNYIPYAMLGTATADANGNWSLQVSPISYPDPVSGVSTVLAPIRNGLSVVSTSLINHTVGINVTGYRLSRPAYSSITGVTDNTVFNTEYSPKRMLLAHKSKLSMIMNQQRNEKIYFQTADKNGNLRTVLGTEVIAERDDVPISSLGSPIGLLEYANIKVAARHSFAQTLYNFSSGGYLKATFRGSEIFFLPIGSMKMNSINDSVQEWKLLLAPTNQYMTLLNLYKTGITVNLMQNALYHSDYNSLHMVTYNYQALPQYNNKTIYDDWFENRNEAWLNNPPYIQKFQETEVIRDQIITNGLADVTLKVYDCFDGSLIGTLNYAPVVPAPVPTPDVVQEVEIDFADYADKQIFFVIHVGATPVCISERVEVREKWYDTILIESNHTVNLPGVFFSTGFKTIIRTEGLVKKLQPDVVTNVAKEEDGDGLLLYGNVSRKRVIRFGTAYGLPDYLYLKIANALTNEDLFIEGVGYALDQDEKIEPSDDVDGHPLYYYNVNLTLRTNNKGKVFAGGPNEILEGVILVVDATAFGLPTGSLITINVDNE